MRRAAATIACALALCLSACATTAQAKGNRSEKKVGAWVDRHEEEAIAFLEKAVNINSGTMNLAGVRKVGELYAAEFQKLGMETQWIELPESMQRAGHLVARTKGTGGQRVLLIGHLDTVFEPNSPFQRFERSGEHMAEGPGVSDMKGGNTVILFALRALHAAGLLDQLAVTVILNGDEEKPGAPLDDTRKILIELARESHVALGFESLVDHLDTATINRRGFTSWTLTVEGTQGHSSRIFSEKLGNGAIYEIARILNAFREELSNEENLTFSPGRLLGGTELRDDAEAATGQVSGKRNVVPKIAMATGDLRALSPEQVERTREKMRAIVAQSLPGTRATIEFQDGYPPMAPTAANRALLDLLSQVNADMGRAPIEAVAPMRRGAADISFVAPLIPSMDGLGLLGFGDHSPDEKVDLRSVRVATTRAALLIYRLGRMKPGSLPAQSGAAH